MISNNLLMVLHNSHSRKAVKFFTDTCVGLSCRNIIFSKITASAASIGIPEAQKSIIKAGGNLLFFTDIIDIVETLKPHKIYLIVSRKYSKKSIPYDDITNELKNGKVLVVVGGTSSGLTRKDMDLGDCVFVNEVFSDINPIALTAIFLSALSKPV